MRSSTFALAGLAILAAMTAAIFGMLAEGGGKAEAVTTISMTDIITDGGSIALDASGPPCSVSHGGFTLSSTVVSPCGDGVDDITRWEFDFTDEPSLATFAACGPLTKAELNFDLVTKHSLVSNDTIGIAKAPGFPGINPMVIHPGTYSGFVVDLLNTTLHPGYGSTNVLAALNGPTAGIIPMAYQDDAIITSARLTLEVNCQAGPPVVGGIAGLRGDADTPADASGGSASSGQPLNAVALGGGVAALVALTAAAAWYTRRRLLN